ncbi:MAG: hypothetical protein KAY32_17390, partial [Candidatus Eisenbacteria sp.]|nr:hypothetical protein [Candidatus Eisenbacteria bacterium]
SKEWGPPLLDLTYRCDSALLTTATDFAGEQTWHKELGFPRPANASPSPKCKVGPVASGDKVVDDPDAAFFKAVIDAWPKLVAVEMEGAAAALAAAESVSAGILVSFLMIRSISDLPGKGEESGTIARDEMKQCAANTAASFACSLIVSGLPLPPAKKRAVGKSRKRAAAKRETPIDGAIRRARLYLKSVQRKDGGVPATHPPQESGCWTTASSLEAEIVASSFESMSFTFVENACDYLLKHQHDTGGWPIIGGPVASSLATGHAVRALVLLAQRVPDSPLAEGRKSAIERGFHWLESVRTPENGWGVEPDGSGEGLEFRIVSTYYALRAFLARGDNFHMSDLVRAAVHAIAQLQEDSGAWTYVSGLQRGTVPCPSNTARAVILMLESGYRSPNDPSIERAMKSVMAQRCDRSWRLSQEMFTEAKAHAQNVYHNNTPCDVPLALLAAPSHSEERRAAVAWLIEKQREDGAWVLQSPDPAQNVYKAETWPTSEFITVLAGEGRLNLHGDTDG